MRDIALVICLICSYAGAFPATTGVSRLVADKAAQDKVKPVPSLKKPDKTKVDEVALPKVRKRYDSGRNATYVTLSVVPLVPGVSEVATNGKEAATTWNINFQLVYRGSSATDLIAAYLIVDSTTSEDRIEKLAAIQQIEVDADGYRYSYPRADYKTESIAATVAPPTTATSPNTRPLSKETLIVKLVIDDLSQIAYANKLEIKLGKIELTVKSIQLIDFRRILLSGG